MENRHAESPHAPASLVDTDYLPPRQARPQRGWIVALALTLATAGIIALVLLSFNNASMYSKGVDQVLAEKDKWVNRNLRVEGTLVKGTLKFQEKPCQYEFDVIRNGVTMHVRWPSCIRPDNLRDDMPDVGVTAEGKLTQSGEFQASNVLAKCPTKYDEKKNSSVISSPSSPHALPAIN